MKNTVVVIRLVICIMSLVMVWSADAFAKSAANAPSVSDLKDPYNGGVKLGKDGGEPEKARKAFLDALYSKDPMKICLALATPGREKGCPSFCRVLAEPGKEKECDDKEIMDWYITMGSQEPPVCTYLGGFMKGEDAILYHDCTIPPNPPTRNFTEFKRTKGKWLITRSGGSASTEVNVGIDAQADFGTAAEAASPTFKGKIEEARPKPKKVAEAGQKPGKIRANEAASATIQPELATLKSTFIPGGKTLFYDDFTDMSTDSPPPHFKVRGSGVELQAAGDTRQLTTTQRGSIFPNLTALPKNFTLETELMVETNGRAIFHFIMLNGSKQALVISTTASNESLQQIQKKLPKYEDLGRKKFKADWEKPVKLAFWVQDGRVRTYVNGEKMLDFNQVEIPPITSVEFAHDFYGPKQSIGYRSVRFAETAPDFSQVINSSGRYVTYGIRFETGSATLQPDSSAVIQTIAKGLEADPGLKLLIEGHTDSVGGDDANLELSRQRAAAVKEALVSSFGIDASRLDTVGLGATKPLDTNATPQGRAQNRRVELVKL